MNERWVLNASPLISLARIGYHRLLLDIPAQVVLPLAVAEEIAAGPEGDPARLAVASGLFPIAASLSAEEIVAWDLGKGETAVLSYALGHEGWTAVLDDQAARRCARSFAIPLRGTLGIVILAKMQGLIPSAAQVLRALRDAGLRLDARLLRDALARYAGESWED